jgi:hypothetical protein
VDEVLIMATLVQHLLLGMQEALAIYFALIGLVILGLVSISAPAWRGRPNRREPRPAGRKIRRARLVAHADDLQRYAEEVAVAAGRAAATAQRKRAEWAAAQRTQEATQRAFEAADLAARRAIQATAFGVPQGPLTLSELNDRRRHLHRATNEAHRRGEISGQQLVDALFETNGWDPYRHPFDQEAMLRRIGRDRLRRAYQATSAIERTAWQTASIATAAMQSLESEALVAAQRAERAQSQLAIQVPQRLSVRPAGLASPAAH